MRKLFVLILACLTMLPMVAEVPDGCVLDTIKGKAVYRYTVKKGEGLYRISKNLSVTQAEIVQWNPILETEGLKLDQVILIPVNEANAPTVAAPTVAAPAIAAPTAVAPTAAAPTVAEPAPVVSAAPVIEETPVQPELPVLPDTLAVPVTDVLPVRIVLLLPFNAEQTERDVTAERMLSFYEGVLMALYEEQLHGQHLELYVFDTGRGTNRMQQLLARPELQLADLWMGPAYPAQVTLAAAEAARLQKPCILPFCNKVEELAANPYLLQFNPTVPDGYKAVVFQHRPSETLTRYDLLLTHFFRETSIEQTNRYDLLGYDLTRYAVRSVLHNRGLETDADRRATWEHRYEGLQSTLHFVRQGEGGYMNEPLEIIEK